MPRVEPILIFSGQANQAIDLYTKAFDADLKVKILFSEANPQDWQSDEEDKDLIYHAQIKIGNQIIMLGDDCDAVKKGIVKTTGNSFLIDMVITFDTDEELKKAYDALYEGATITSPLCSQSYCSLTCSLIDKFGGRWQLMSGYDG